MKQLLSLILAFSLLAALTVSPAAEESQDAGARLAKVTQAVKTTLNLDTSGYDSFHGSSSEELIPVWDLNWEDGRRSLSVQALEDGTVISFYLWESDVQPLGSRYGFPTFPDSAGAGDRVVAEDFLKRVLRSGETAELSESGGGNSLDSSDSSWSGSVLLNGLPSPLRWYLTVENGQVTQFSRDIPETSHVGGVPGSDSSVQQSAAAADLRKTLALKLEYVRGDGNKAVLRYVPGDQHEFLVDARTGELLDLTELSKSLKRGYDTAAGMSVAATAETAADENGAFFTEAEQEGIHQMEGALPKDQLDKSLREVGAYGLTGYALASVSYAQDGEDLTCTLRYGRLEGENRSYRTFRVDARTGEVQSINSTSPWNQEPALTEDEAREKAQAFLKEFCPDRTLEYYETPARREGAPFYRFRFARKANDIFYPENSYSISIDGRDGSVYGLSFTWDEDAAFEDPKGVVSPETALSAWAESYEAVLAYRSVPRKLSAADAIQARLIGQGMEYYYGLRLTYGLEREVSYTGVDAKTGKLVQPEWEKARVPLAYTDLSGSSAKADIEKLARYGAGYASDRFRPSKTLTQWDLVALLYSLQGTALDPESAGEDARDSAYFYAYRSGALRQSERNDNAVLARADLVRILLNASGYGPAARLNGKIFTCSYTDKGSIPAEGLGYAAVAQALGMASGTYAGGRSATRGEAASMLCRVLERPA